MKFSDEQDCKQYVRQIREQEGVICKKCSGTRHFWKSDKEMWQCKGCSFRTSLRSGTVMEGSKLPFSYWLAGMQFLTATKKSFSARSIQMELGHKRYEPIWAMLHKLRLAMGQRDKTYQLTEYVEMDEGFFEKADKKKENPDEEGTDDKKNRGRGSQRQVKVLVSAETRPGDGTDKGKSTAVKYIKMAVMESLTSGNINKEVQAGLNRNTTVTTDGYRGYSRLKQIVKDHIITIASHPKEAGKLFPWVHTAISNSKRLFLGTFHRIDGIYRQNYLNEFCYKFNRRYFGDKLFDRLVIASIAFDWKGHSSG